MKQPPEFDRLSVMNWEPSQDRLWVYPPIGFCKVQNGEWGNGDFYGLYWPYGREGREPIVCEMVHEEFNQIPVQAQVDVTFSTILRNILRQDPDVIMIGEIRDLDTATHAIQAALTGHLVFSTLHTNDAVASISRLVDLGVEPFMIGSTLLGAMAQRLVRRICPHCTESFPMSAKELRGLGFPLEDADGEIELKRGKGCQECRGTGYLGRCGVFEIFPMSEALKKMTSNLDPETEIRKKAIAEGMTTLKQDAWQKVKTGITTYEEAMRVTGAD